MQPEEKAKHPHAKSRKGKPKPPDPALEWKECGDRCLAAAFGNNLSPVRIAPGGGKGAVTLRLVRECRARGARPPAGGAPAFRRAGPAASAG